MFIAQSGWGWFFAQTMNFTLLMGALMLAQEGKGGGLGAIALQYGYYRYQKDVLWTTVALLILMVMLIQEVGIRLSKKTRKT